MSQWIAALTRGHNGGVCLLKDGEIVFAIEFQFGIDMT